MVKHIVMWKLKEDNKLENAQKIKKSLEALNGVIEVIKSLEVGVNYNSSMAAYDVVLVSEFENDEALAIYQTHPKHIAIGEFVKSVSTDRKVVDYII